MSNDYTGLPAQITSSIKEVIKGMDIPHEIKTFVDRKVENALPGILSKTVPGMIKSYIDESVGWYKESIERLQEDSDNFRAGIKQEGSKRREVHRAHMALYKNVVVMEEYCRDLNQKVINLEKKLNQLIELVRSIEESVFPVAEEEHPKSKGLWLFRKTPKK